jgi:hypothetical protein
MRPPTEAALLSFAQLTVKPAVGFHIPHGVGRSAINTLKFATAAGFFRQHQLHDLFALWAGRRIGLDLWHNASLDQAGACSALSHRRLPMAVR